MEMFPARPCKHVKCVVRPIAISSRCCPHIPTANVLEALALPPGVERLLLKTDNTSRRLMWQRDFEPSYTGLTTSGAQWLARHGSVRLVGIDYLSIAIMEDIAEPHRVLFRKVCAGGGS